MEDMPKDMVKVLRELVPCVEKPLSAYPIWFQQRYLNGGKGMMGTILSSAADELETMQKLNGKLYKTLYPD